MDDLLTPAELRERLKISMTTYRRLLRRGLPHVLVMSDRRFIWPVVLGWLPKSTAPVARPSRPVPSIDLVRMLKAEVKLYGGRR
jgi:hypothetical protein